MAIAIEGKTGDGARLTNGDAGRLSLKMRVADVVGHIDEQVERVGIPKDGDAIVVIEARSGVHQTMIEAIVVNAIDTHTRLIDESRVAIGIDVGIHT